MAENNIVITSDSTCDLGEKLISERGIKIMPLTVILGADSFKDGINIEPEDIFSYFDRTGELPKTGAPSVSDYENFFAEFVDAGKTVIHFNISSKASGANGFAQAAQKTPLFFCSVPQKAAVMQKLQILLLCLCALELTVKFFYAFL